MALKINEIVDAVKELTVLELNDLVKAIETEFGVTAAAVAVGGGAAAPAAEAEKTEFDVILASFGEKKMDVIKVAKEVLGLGLKEAKEFVESAPKAIKEGASKAEGEELKAKFEAAGAKVELK